MPTSANANSTAASSSGVEFLLILLRNVSQVVLQNNALSGAIILAGIFWHSIDFGLAAVAGSVVATLTAMFLKTDRGAVGMGLYGFNAVLTAIAIVFYCETAFDTIDISWWLIGVYVIFGSIFATVLTAALGEMLSGAGVPALTAPFVLASWLFVAGTHFSPNLSPGHIGAPQQDATATTQADDKAEASDSDADDEDEGEEGEAAEEIHSPNYEWDTWWEGAGKGIGEIFFQDDAISGYLILLGILVNSPISALMAFIGALISIGVAEALHVRESEIHLGMFSYSAILTAIAIGGLFYLLTVRSFIFTILGVILTTWLYAALASILQPLHLPAYTAPFVLVTWILLYSKNVFQGLVAIPLSEATTPEDNLRRFRKAN